MNPALQAIYDKVQTYIRAKAVPAPNPALVWADHVSTIHEDTLAFLESQLSIPPETNFAPWDEEEEYSNVMPDYVSHLANVWEYIYPTPSTGIEPGTNGLYWALATSGALMHQQNTDLGTNSQTFEIGRNTAIASEPSGSRVMVFGGPIEGQKAAIRQSWVPGEVDGTIYSLQITSNYLEGGGTVWDTIATGTDIAYLIDSINAAVTSIGTKMDKPEPFSALTVSAGATTWATAGKYENNKTLLLDANITLSITGHVNGATGTLIVKQDATGARTLTLPATSSPATISLNTLPNSETVLGWKYDGTKIRWVTNKNT